MRPADRYDRQRLLPAIGVAGQERLSRARAAIVGCGAIGTVVAEYLARAGVGRLLLIDRDIVDVSNLGRQIAFTEDDAREGRPKALALAAHLARVNSQIAVEPRPFDLDFANARELVADVEIVLDATDNAPTRFLINDLALELAVPWIYAGAIGTGGHVLAFPARGRPCLRCYLPEPPPAGTLPTCDTAGVLGPAVAAVAGIEAALAIRVLVEGESPRVCGRLLRLDAWHAEWHEARVEGDPACLACAGHRREFLDGARADESVVLCGRGAIQVRPLRRPTERDALAALATRLETAGRVERHAHYLRLRAPDFTMTVFADLRAVFDGLTDGSRARSLYARLIGE